MASSASGFAALVFGLLNVLDVKVDLPSTLAPLGSGSAWRSMAGGIVKWHAGKDHDTSFAETIA